jgi:phage FluMu gp28-like protein
MRTNQVLVDKPGRISACGGLNIQVHFDLVETQDFVNGHPSLKFSFGNLRYKRRHADEITALVLSRRMVSLKGGGIETTVFLNSEDSFAVMGAITAAEI